MGATRKKFTPEQRAEYQKAQRELASERLKTAVESLQSTDGFRAWVEARARFHNYSFHNTLLILAQKPDATRVAAASVWRELGRYPAKGSHALRVFAPFSVWREADEGDPGARWNAKRNRWERKITYFNLVPVFDVSQTDGEDLPAAPESAPIDGDSHAHLEPALVTLASDLEYTVATEAITDGSSGYCLPEAKRIVLDEGLSPNGRVRVLIHEIAHALGIDYKDYSRSEAETIVEAATYIVLAGQGIDADASSIPYIAGWSGKDGHEKLVTFAETIDKVARRIEQAL